MSVQIRFPYKVDGADLYFMVMDDTNGHLRSDTGFFEVWNEPYTALYKSSLSLIINSDGVFFGQVPPIDPSLLPMDINVFIFDPATVLTGPIGIGRVRVGRDGNEQPNDRLLYNIYASTVGKTQGVGTLEEEYYGYDDFLGFSTTFDTTGNRIVVVE